MKHLTWPFKEPPFSGRVRAAQRKRERVINALDRRSKSESTSESMVVKWLLNHPESTADEVFKGCGRSVLTNPRFLQQKRTEDGNVLWSVNLLRYRYWLRTGNEYWKTAFYKNQKRKRKPCPASESQAAS